MKKYKFTIIIAAFNPGEKINSCLKSIKKVLTFLIKKAALFMKY